MDRAQAILSGESVFHGLFSYSYFCCCCLAIINDVGMVFVAVATLLFPPFPWTIWKGGDFVW